jgi:hypothetical protein
VDEIGLDQPRAGAVAGQSRFIHETWLRDHKGQGFARPVH